MARSVTLTLVIVFVIYASLLWVNGMLSLNEVTHSENYKQSAKADRLETVNKVNKTQLTADSNTKSLSKLIDNQSQIKQYIQPFRLTGVAGSIDLKNQHDMQNQIEQVWEEFSKSNALHEAMSWDKGHNEVFTYFYNTNQKYSESALIIGYALDSVEGFSSVTVKKAQITSYPYNESGFSPEAWAKISARNAILERYTVDTKSRLNPIDVLLLESEED